MLIWHLPLTLFLFKIQSNHRAVQAANQNNPRKVFARISMKMYVHVIVIFTENTF